MFSVSFPPLILMQVQIIRDNLISSLNHCDLVYSVSLACPTPVSFNHFYYFNFLFLTLSRAVSEQSISITSATQEFKYSLLLSFFASPSVSFSSPPTSQWQPITAQMKENYYKIIKLYSRSYYLHMYTQAHTCTHTRPIWQSC